MLPPAANPKRPFWVPAGAGGGEDGAGTATAAVATEFATVAPLTFDAFTAMRSVVPASAGEITWIALVCAAIGAHAAPPASQRSHSYVMPVTGPPHVPLVAVSVLPVFA